MTDAFWLCAGLSLLVVSFAVFTAILLWVVDHL